MTRRWGDSTGASTGVYPHCFGGKNRPKKYMCLAKLFISSAKSQLTFYSPNLLGAPQIGGQTGRPSNNFPISNPWHLLLWLCSLSCQRVTHEMFLNIYIISRFQMNMETLVDWLAKSRQNLKWWGLNFPSYFLFRDHWGGHHQFTVLVYCPKMSKSSVEFR